MTDLFKTPEEFEEEIEKGSNSFVKDFFNLMKKSQEGCEDCEPLVCPCGGELEIVFGSLPLEVVCKDCRACYHLREMVKVD